MTVTFLTNNYILRINPIGQRNFGNAAGILFFYDDSEKKLPNYFSTSTRICIYVYFLTRLQTKNIFLKCI